MSLGKILVVGASEAGKSTLISALSSRAVNLAVRGRTVAMDHATLVRGRDRLSLVGVPGQKRFGPVREALAEGARGSVWVHRAGAQLDSETAALVGQLAAQGARYLVVINRHRGIGGDNGWSPPPALPPPSAVVETDLLDPGETLTTLQQEIWMLASAVPAATTKGA